MSTVQAAKWIKSLTYSDIPPDVIDRARHSIADCIGLALFVGSNTDMGRIICRYALLNGGSKPESTVLSTGRRASASAAALANGALALGFEFEDVHIASYTHPYTTVVPSALALAEQSHKDGKNLITAVVCGQEIVIRIGAAIDFDERRRSADADGTCRPCTASTVQGRRQPRYWTLMRVVS